MYYAADRTPVVVAEVNLNDLGFSPVSTKNLEKTAFSVYPNPNLDGRFFIKNANNEQVKNLKIFAADGRVVYSGKMPNPGQNLPLPNEKGVYLLVVETKNGRWVEKIVRQ